MIAAMINGSPDPEDVRRYYRALKRAQRDIDLRPELYTRYYKNEFPERYHAMMDTRRWGPGERIVFETYSKEAFEQPFDWIARHDLCRRPDGVGRLRQGRGPFAPRRGIPAQRGTFADRQRSLSLRPRDDTILDLSQCLTTLR
jgi:hypothetical protein